ncbi:MAG TPA: hypothetical protein VMT90_06750 [Dehalococcoidia bacterium]|jgi:hypothetical protein|nr:hypothetical protein [Dehalococcoidia bacterium]
MNTRAILASMTVAVAVLIGAVAYLAFFSGSSASGPPGSVSTSTNCSKYRLDHRREVELNDPYVKGVIEIGFNEGFKSTEAAGLLKTLGTAAYIPLPYTQHAFICVKPGFEDEWVARMKTYDWVEFAHRDYSNPIDTLGQ